MNCKHCQAPLEDGNSICPSCGWDNTLPEEMEPISSEELQTAVTPEEAAQLPEQEAPQTEELSQPKPINKKKLVPPTPQSWTTPPPPLPKQPPEKPQNPPASWSGRAIPLTGKTSLQSWTRS